MVGHARKTRAPSSRRSGHRSCGQFPTRRRGDTAEKDRRRQVRLSSDQESQRDTIQLCQPRRCASISRAGSRFRRCLVEPCVISILRPKARGPSSSSPARFGTRPATFPPLPGIFPDEASNGNRESRAAVAKRAIHCTCAEMLSIYVGRPGNSVGRHFRSKLLEATRTDRENADDCRDRTTERSKVRKRHLGITSTKPTFTKAALAARAGAGLRCRRLQAARRRGRRSRSSRGRAE